MTFYPKERLKFERVSGLLDVVPLTFGTALRKARQHLASFGIAPSLYDLDVQISPEAWYKLRWSSEIDLLFSVPFAFKSAHLPAFWDKPPERLYGARMIASACAPPDEVTIYRPATGDMVVYQIE